MILATDLDRTLLPNGHEPYDGSLPRFFYLVKEKEFTLVYVTGRSLELFHEAQKEFAIETPHYLLADVGSSLYVRDGDGLIPDAGWATYLQNKTPRWSTETMQNAIAFEGLRLQEEEKQKKYKLSYYLDTDRDTDHVIESIQTIIRDELQIDATVIYSVDPLTGDGLVDILPRVATKVTGLEFLRERLSLEKGAVIYCGDSGNDILPLSNGYRSVLVANAHEDARMKIEQRVSDAGLAETLYIADGSLHSKLNGNYSSGILEGLLHLGIIEATDLTRDAG